MVVIWPVHKQGRYRRDLEGNVKNHFHTSEDPYSELLQFHSTTLQFCDCISRIEPAPRNAAKHTATDIRHRHKHKLI